MLMHICPTPMCTHVRMYVWTPEGDCHVRGFLNGSPPFFFPLSLKLELTDWLDWQA